MNHSAQTIELRKDFITSELFEELQKLPDGKRDYFTQTEDYPKSFRVGQCAVLEENSKTKVQVLMFWKDDTKSAQNEIQIEVLKRDQNWLINKVE